MAYITDEYLLGKVAARLGTTVELLTDEAEQWIDIVADANVEAYNAIRTALVARGYDAETADLWDRREEFNRKLGLCFALRDGALTREYDSKALDRLCNCEEALETVPILINGVEAEVESGEGSIGYGDMSRDDDVMGDDFEL